MATTKNWTAYDLALGSLTIRRDVDDAQQQIIRFEQRYLFVDDQDDVLAQIAGGRYVNEMLIASIPQNVLDALQTINTYLYNRCLEQEGMQDP